MTIATSAAPHFLFLIASARRHGNSEQLAQRAAAALPPGTRQTWLRLDEHPLPVFADQRHASPDGWSPTISGEARVLLEATLAATDIVLVAPVYWYSLPASAKLYLDHWTAWLRAPAWNFRERMAGKTLWGVSALSDSDPELAAPLRETLRLSAAYMQMPWGGLLLGEGNRPGDVLNDARALRATAEFFRAKPTPG